MKNKYLDDLEFLSWKQFEKQDYEPDFQDMEAVRKLLEVEMDYEMVI